MQFTPSKKPYLQGKTLFITGASRGIGREIALRAAKDGANIAIIAKTTEPHPKLPGTIYTVAEEVCKIGGKALPIACDIRDDVQIKAAIEATVKEFGGIDIVVNNASAISLVGTSELTMKKYDLMHQINVRGTFAVSKAALPYLLEASNPHILMLSPPLDFKGKWFASHPAYSMSKYGMSMATFGLAEELRSQGVAVNALWPKTMISTSALQAFAGDQLSVLHKKSRNATIVADAAYAIFCQKSSSFTRVFAIDEEVLKAQGVTNLLKYSMDPSTPISSLTIDLFVDDEQNGSSLSTMPLMEKVFINKELKSKV